jgi:hypothetical protein
MDEVTLNQVAACLERLAEQAAWHSELWQQCHDLVRANWDNDLLEYVYDDIVHYSGEFHSRNIFGFRTKPDRRRLERFSQEFRDIAAALRSSLSLSEARKIYDL